MSNQKILKAVFILLVIVVIGGVLYYGYQTKHQPPAPEPEVIIYTPEPAPTPTKIKVVGHSVEGRAIETYTYGTGSTTLLFVGGVHGGYEWNSTLLAYEFIDQLENKTISIPNNLKIVVIPTLNPDGLYTVLGKEGRFSLSDISEGKGEVTGLGRFNANDVDLNRNFDCKWQPTSNWRGKIVSAGDKAFSEPEAIALRDLVQEINPTAVVFWHSQANAVYASECEAGILPETLAVMKAYAGAANYKAVQTFDAYPVTGDAEGWLASIGIPAVTVELSSHTKIEWEKNEAGIKALFSLYKLD